jgi:hypothetical protein
METLNVRPPSMQWNVYRDDTTVLTLILLDLDGNALDLTGWNFTGKVRQFPKSVGVLDTLQIVKDQNVLTIGLDTTDLDTVSYFDIQGTNQDTGKISTILSGQIYIEEDVTR